MVAPHGTYAAIVFPIILPSEAVVELLPAWMREGTQNTLCPIPEAELQALGAPNEVDPTSLHVLLVQLGWQAGTGIGPNVFGMNFHEFKIDIPYVRHPRYASGSTFTYKLAIGFDKHLLHLAGYIAPGPERCIYAGAGAWEGIKQILHFSRPPATPASEAGRKSAATLTSNKVKGVQPHTSPSLSAYPAGAPSISYTVPGVTSVEFQTTTEDKKSWDTVRSLLAQPWFAGWTGSKAVEFVFDFPSDSSSLAGRTDTLLAPEAYMVSSGVLLPHFLGSKTSIAQAAKVKSVPGVAAIDVGSGILIPAGTRAWRFTAPFSGKEKEIGSYN